MREVIVVVGMEANKKQHEVCHIHFKTIKTQIASGFVAKMIFFLFSRSTNSHNQRLVNVPFLYPAEFMNHKLIDYELTFEI